MKRIFLAVQLFEPQPDYNLNNNKKKFGKPRAIIHKSTALQIGDEEKR